MRLRPAQRLKMYGDWYGDRRVTITLPVGQVDRIKGLVESGHAASVSGFVELAVGTALDDVAGWEQCWYQPLTSREVRYHLRSGPGPTRC